MNNEIITNLLSGSPKTKIDEIPTNQLMLVMSMLNSRGYNTNIHSEKGGTYLLVSN